MISNAVISNALEGPDVLLAPILRILRVAAVMSVTLVGLACCSSQASAQSSQASTASQASMATQPTLRMTGTNTVRKVQKYSVPKSDSTSKQFSDSRSVVPASILSDTQSIVQSASHEEVLIPTAMHTGDASVVACDDCSLGPNASESMYDYIVSDKQCGSHYFLFDWSRADLWVGTSSFVNPSSTFTNAAGTNVGQVEGAFGFQEGFNFGSQLPSLLSGQVGSQIGMRFVQSNLAGTQLSNSSRNQMFATAGLFRRVDYGFQGGVVFDYLHDQWIERVDLAQLRGELSFLFSPAHEIGFRFTENGRTSQQQVRIPSSGTLVTSQLRALDTYRLFGRRRFGPCAASVVEAHLGTSNDGGVLMGLLLQNPLSGQLGLEASANYFIPKSSLAQKDMHEAWSIGMAIVWTPGRSFGTQRDYYRPLFEVAGSGTLIATRP